MWGSRRAGKVKVMKNWLRNYCRVGLASIFLAGTHLLGVAQPIVHDVEPNDTPDTFQPISGDVKIMGLMPSGDQDGFLWTVEEEQSLLPWTFTLQGIPGALTMVDVLQLQYAEDGQTLTGTKKLFMLGSRDGSRPITQSGLLFEPGEYVLGFARAGGDGTRPPLVSGAFATMGEAFVGKPEEVQPNPVSGLSPDENESAHAPNLLEEQPLHANGYRLNITQARALRLNRAGSTDPTREAPLSVRLNSPEAWLAPAKISWYRFKLNEADAQQRWNISIGTPLGQVLKASLEDAAGKQLAFVSVNALGQAELADLSLPEGEYLLRLEGELDVLQLIAVTAAGLKVKGEEAEPNDKWSSANKVDLFEGVSGRFQVDRDEDVYRFELSEEQADQRLALRLDTNIAEPYTVCLLDDAGANIQCREPNGDWLMEGIALEAGRYGVKLLRGKTGMQYRLSLQGDGKHDHNVEAEPNDDLNWATTIKLGKRLRGEFDASNDHDFYRVDVEGTPQMWRFQVNGDTIKEMSYYDGRGRRLQTTHANSHAKRLMLDRLYLVPGTHYISVRGSDKGDYVLLTRAQGMPDPNAESEPNDSEQNMLGLRTGQTRTGGFHDAKDKDMYYFQLANYEHIRLTLKAPLDADVKMRAVLAWENSVLKELDLGGKEEVSLQGVYPPGSYVLTLFTNQPTEDQYQLSLQRLPRYSCDVDCEPNHNAAFSNSLPIDGYINGRADPTLRGDIDWYRLPVQDQATDWHFETTSPAQLAIHIEQDDKEHRLKRESSEQPYRFSVPAGEQGYLVVKTNADYQIQARPDGGGLSQPPLVELDEVSMSLHLPVNQFAAYAQLGQHVAGTIRLQNAGSQDVTLNVDVVASDLNWQVTPEESMVELPKGESREIALNIRAPADLRAIPTQVSARAAHASGAFIAAEIAIDVMSDAAHVGPEAHWSVPLAVRGGLNLAAASLGGKVLAGEQSKLYRNVDSLIDGMHGTAHDFEWRQQSLPYTASVTVQLAGDGTQAIAGFGLNAHSHVVMHRAPQHFSVELSDDGNRFETVLRGILEPIRHTQYFVMETQRPARYARLIVHQNYNGDWGGNTAIGEWQVIAKPGTTVDEQPFNLAAPRHGGHVVHAQPTAGRNPSWIDPEVKTHSGGGVVDVSPKQQAYWVLGFRDNRAARVDRIVWEKAREDKRESFDDIDVQISLQGPVGPWTSVGRIQPNVDQDVELQLPEPVWARFIRFELLPVADTRRRVAAPKSVQVYEAQTNEQHLTTLGVWGGGPEAIYESLYPDPITTDIASSPSYGRRETPKTLELGHPVEARVQLAVQEHWYRVRVPEGNNQLDLHLSDPHYLKAALSVETPDGEPVALVAEQAQGNQRHWIVSAEPGSELLVKVFEPPRNVIFAWDTSGSVRAYREQIRNAMSEYARGLVPGRDMANLLPFGGALQLQQWNSDPYLMLQALNEHTDTDSSSAESTLHTASQALAKRSGSRAVILITDAETPTDPTLWPALEQGQPQVIALGLGAAQRSIHGNSKLEKQLMLNWSLVNGGYYSKVHDINDMAHAFERTSVLLRQPASYRLQVDATFVEPPAHGTLSVVAASVPKSPKQTARPGPATAIILDASGSMLQRLGGERRIEIAKRGLLQAVSQKIPPGTPVSLRVFGHKEAGSCRSDLELPLKPLDIGAARQIISSIQARNLARTPIADSLALVRQDLAQAKGPRTIVLVTDGEETCEGDPEAVIRELISEGFDVRLNIIGFALDDPDLEQTFGKWARLGGGEYFSATDKQSFDLAVAKALQVAYTVIDASGTAIAHGNMGGDPVALPPGNYQVRVGLTPEVVLDAVQVKPEEATVAEVH